MNWQDTGAVAPRALTEARIQLHCGGLVLASAAHSLLEHAGDDSHSNFGFESATGSLHTRVLAGGASLHLDLPTFALVLRNGEGRLGEAPLAGRSLRGAMDWVEQRLSEVAESSVEITQREFPDFPDSPVMQGAAFPQPPADALDELTRWFANGQALLETLRAEHEQLSELRVWPHHFDLGALLPLGGDAMIGLGLSPGDEHHDQPYFYCSPYPQPSPDADLPVLALGGWQTEGFVSALLTAEDVQASSSQGAAATTYLETAVAACRGVLS